MLMQSVNSLEKAPFPWHYPDTAASILEKWTRDKVDKLIKPRSWFASFSSSQKYPDLILVCASTKCTMDIILSTLCVSEALNVFRNDCKTYSRGGGEGNSPLAIYLPYLPIPRIDFELYGDLTAAFNILGRSLKDMQDCFLFSDSFIHKGLRPLEPLGLGVKGGEPPFVNLILMAHQTTYWNDISIGGPLMPDSDSKILFEKNLSDLGIVYHDTNASYAQWIINGLGNLREMDCWISGKLFSRFPSSTVAVGMASNDEEKKKKNKTIDGTDTEQVDISTLDIENDRQSRLARYKFWQHRPYLSTLMLLAISIHTEHFTKIFNVQQYNLENKALCTIRHAIPTSFLLDLKGM